MYGRGTDGNVAGFITAGVQETHITGNATVRSVAEVTSKSGVIAGDIVEATGQPAGIVTHGCLPSLPPVDLPTNSQQSGASTANINWQQQQQFAIKEETTNVGSTTFEDLDDLLGDDNKEEVEEKSNHTDTPNNSSSLIEEGDQYLNKCLEQLQQQNPRQFSLAAKWEDTFDDLFPDFGLE